MKKILRIFPIAVLFIFITMSGKVFAASASTPPSSGISSIVNNQYITCNTNISGWSLNSSGISGIQIAIDGRGIGWTPYNVSTHTFSYNLGSAIYGISSGAHTLKVISYGKNGKTSVSSVKVNKRSQIMAVDSPTPSQKYTSASGRISVKGWALSADGIKNVKVYLDGSSTAAVTTTTVVSRPDVAKAYSGYASEATSGYSTGIDISTIKAGIHTVTVSVTGNGGKVNKITRNISITKNPPKSSIESITNNQYITSGTNISGWCLNESGIAGIQVAVDGRGVGWTPATSTPRTDINKAYPKYVAKVYDFSYNIGKNVAAMSNGKHTLMVIIYGKDGSQSVSSVTVNKKSQAAALNSPTQGQTYNTASGKITITGWALNAAGINNVKAYLDGSSTAFATMTTGVSRPDVAKTYTGYANESSSGYSTSIDISKIMAGAHTIAVSVTGNDGAVTKITRNITVTKYTPVSRIESITNNQYITSETQISGWALNDSGYSGIQIEVDGRSIGWANYSSSPRTDINSSYPQFKQSAEGYSFKIGNAINGLSSGKHTLQVISYGVDGSTTTNTLTVIKHAQVFKLEAPVSAQSIDITQNSSLNFSGWAANAGGIAKVELFVDGGSTPSVTTSTNVARPDISSVITGYANESKLGYKFGIDLNTLPPGENSLKVRATGNDGSVSESTISLTLSKPAAHGKIETNNMTGFIDSITGWAVNYEGVKKIVAFADGNSSNAVAVAGGQFRTTGDIHTLYQNYSGSSNCNYSVNFNALSLSAGNHNVTIRVFGNDGSSNDYTVAVTVPIKIYTSFNISLSTLASKNSVATSAIDPSVLSANSVNAYEFMRLNWVDGVTAAEINAILLYDHQTACAPFNGTDVFLTQPPSVNVGQVILNACKANNLNPLYFVAHMILESGHGTSALASGIAVNAGTYYDTYGRKVVVTTSGTYYNLFGIHAYDGHASRDGSQYAASQGWSSLSDSITGAPGAITGAAAWISDGYVNAYLDHGGYDQNTLYEMKWDPYGWAKYSNRAYEYATDNLWAQSIAKLISQYVNQYPALKSVQLKYDLPQFK